MCTELLSVDQDSDICEDISVTQPIQVEQNITCMACELYAAVCCASHFVKFCKQKRNMKMKSQKGAGLGLFHCCAKTHPFTRRLECS